MIKLISVKKEDRELFYNIHQKYLYEMTNFYDDTMDDKGNYEYGYFDAYFTEPKRKAYYIYSDNKLAGFVMINPYSYIDKNPDYVLAEFTVFPIYRKKHIASEAAKAVFEKHPGTWEVKYNENNVPAKNLWNKICGKYKPLKTRISDFETVLSFSTK